MQYHFDGFRPGDPHIKQRSGKENSDQTHVDVLVVGCGPAGLTLAAQLSEFPEINTRIIDQKSGPLEIGQADGIACRSMEMFEAFGFANKVLREAYWVNETTFWRPNENDTGIVRSDRIQDVEDDLSEMPHTILSQARIHDFYLDVMKNSVHRMEPNYNFKLVELERSDTEDYPVKAVVQSTDDEKTEIVRAKYVVGCDGARSAVRKSLGYELKGESSRQLWGVMDVLAVTDFPDIRLKSAIQSADQGSLLIIPREGGAMIRTYIELGELKGDERAADRNVTADSLIEQARAILSPYTFDVKEVAWCSAYEIGQRVCDRFDDQGSKDCTDETPRVFIAGDACHTHSPKAGQGMNVSMADTFNLGWKLAAVLRDQAQPGLLCTYSAERQAKAQELIDFDRDMAKLFASKSTDKASAKLFQQYFQKHGRYTAGVETHYDPSLIVSGNVHQELARGLKVGMRFHSAPVIRTADAKPMQLGHSLLADGRWRLIAFAPSGDAGEADGQIAKLCHFLEQDQESPIRRYTPSEADFDSVIDLRVVFQSSHREIALEKLPKLLMPCKSPLGLTDYEKVFCPNLKPRQDIFDLRGIDREKGALIILRPDQFVSSIVPLDGNDALSHFFNQFMITKT